ncbi:MAG: hypothetical protein PHH82_00485 [Candidatus ainarchaeum sp.]|nr:hypothetical protein [Candidatus ainarchaeum sp.]
MNNRSSKGFFSVILAVAGVALLLFNISIPTYTSNNYPEFITKNEMQYLYLNNVITKQMADYFISTPGCDFDFVGFKDYLNSNAASFCENFSSEFFKCDIKVVTVFQKFGLTNVTLSINNSFDKGAIHFTYSKEITFSKIFAPTQLTIPMPDGTEQKTCNYTITDFESQLVEASGTK